MVVMRQPRSITRKHGGFIRGVLSQHCSRTRTMLPYHHPTQTSSRRPVPAIKRKESALLITSDKLVRSRCPPVLSADGSDKITSWVLKDDCLSVSPDWSHLAARLICVHIWDMRPRRHKNDICHTHSFKMKL